MSNNNLKNGYNLNEDRFNELISIFYGFEEYFYYHKECHYHDYVKALKLLNDVNLGKLSKEEENAIRGWYIYFQHGKRYMSNNSIVFNITDACQLKCKHCFNQNTVRKNEFMPYDLFVYIFYKHKEICKKFAHNKQKHEYVWIKGGEATLHPECHKFLKFLNDNNINFTLETNGIYLPDKVLSELKRNPSTIVQVSIDGMKETHDFIRGVGTFDKTLKTIKKLLSENISVHTNFCVNTYNYKDLYTYITFFKDLGCYPGHLNYVKHSTEFFDSPNKEVFSYFKNNNIKYPQHPTFSCNFPNQVVINYDGGWKGCDKSGFDEIASYVNDSIDEFVKKVKIFSLKQRCVPTYCHDCFYVQKCMGGEMCNRFFETKCKNMPDEICLSLNIKKQTDLFKIDVPLKFNTTYMNDDGICKLHF